MKEGQTLWNREELILALNLYFRIPFGQAHKSNDKVKQLARVIGRTPSSVALKLGNLGSFDPALQQRGVVGARHASRLDREVWDEYARDPEGVIFESEKILARKGAVPTDELVIPDASEAESFKEGAMIERMIKARVGQSFFRKMILAAYGGACCITGINHPKLLVASHISPWATDTKNRLNPRNGLALNALHDRAYEFGLLSITPEYKIVISTEVKKDAGDWARQHLLPYEGASIRVPQKYAPDERLLEKHLKTVFRG